MFRGSITSDTCRLSKNPALAGPCTTKHKLKKLLNTLGSCGNNLKTSGGHNIDIQPITAAIETAKQATNAAVNTAQEQIDNARIAAQTAKLAAQREKKAAARGVVGGSRRRRRRRTKRRRPTKRRRRRR